MITPAMNYLLSSTLGECQLRKLTHTKTLLHSPALVFKAVSDVSNYPQVFPLTVSSEVTVKDKAGYPTRARIKLGSESLGLDHTWDSIILCDPKKGIIDARSIEATKQAPGMLDGLRTTWTVIPIAGSPKASVIKLDVEVKFRNPVFDQMFYQIQGTVADVMISSFESKLRELEKAQAVAAPVPAKKKPRKPAKLEVRNLKGQGQQKPAKKTATPVQARRKVGEA